MLSSVMRAIGWISNIEGNAFLIKGRCYCGFYFFCNLTSILLRWLFFWLFDWRLRSTSIKHFPFFTVCAGLGLPQVRVRDGTVNSLKKNYNKYDSSFFFQKLLYEVCFILMKINYVAEFNPPYHVFAKRSCKIKNLGWTQFILLER